MACSSRLNFDSGLERIGNSKNKYGGFFASLRMVGASHTYAAGYAAESTLNDAAIFLQFEEGECQ